MTTHKKINYHGLTHNHLGNFIVNLISNQSSAIQKSNSHIIFTFDSTHGVPINEGVHLAVGMTDLILTYSWLDIRSGVNDSFDITYNSQTVTITIPQGTYENAFDFAGQLNILFSQAYPTLGVLLICSVNEKLGKFNFSLTETVSELTISNVKCYRQTGFNKNSDLVISNANSFQSPNVFNFSGSPCVYVCLPNLNIVNPTSSLAKNGIIACVPIDVYPFNLKFYHTTTPIMFQSQSIHQISNIEVQILDEDFQELELNGSTWRMSLLFEYRNNFIDEDNILLSEKN